MAEVELLFAKASDTQYQHYVDNSQQRENSQGTSTLRIHYYNNNDKKDSASYYQHKRVSNSRPCQ